MSQGGLGKTYEFIAMNAGFLFQALGYANPNLCTETVMT